MSMSRLYMDIFEILVLATLPLLVSKQLLRKRIQKFSGSNHGCRETDLLKK